MIRMLTAVLSED